MEWWWRERDGYVREVKRRLFQEEEMDGWMGVGCSEADCCVDCHTRWPHAHTSTLCPHGTQASLYSHKTGRRSGNVSPASCRYLQNPNIWTVASEFIQFYHLLYVHLTYIIIHHCLLNTTYNTYIPSLSLSLIISTLVITQKALSSRN